MLEVNLRHHISSNVSRTKSDYTPSLDITCNKMKLCKVCLRNSAVYTCPQCFQIYCSLSCYQNHNSNCLESFSKQRISDVLILENRQQESRIKSSSSSSASASLSPSCLSSEDASICNGFIGLDETNLDDDCLPILAPEDTIGIQSGHNFKLLSDDVSNNDILETENIIMEKLIEMNFSVDSLSSEELSFLKRRMLQSPINSQSFREICPWWRGGHHYMFPSCSSVSFFSVENSFSSSIVNSTFSSLLQEILGVLESQKDVRSHSISPYTSFSCFDSIPALKYHPSIRYSIFQLLCSYVITQQVYPWLSDPLESTLAQDSIHNTTQEPLFLQANDVECVLNSQHELLGQLFLPLVDPKTMPSSSTQNYPLESLSTAFESWLRHVDIISRSSSLAACSIFSQKISGPLNRKACQQLLQEVACLVSSPSLFVLALYDCWQLSMVPFQYDRKFSRLQKDGENDRDPHTGASLDYVCKPADRLAYGILDYLPQFFSPTSSMKSLKQRSPGNKNNVDIKMDRESRKNSDNDGVNHGVDGRVRSQSERERDRNNLHSTSAMKDENFSRKLFFYFLTQLQREKSMKGGGSDGGDGSGCENDRNSDRDSDNRQSNHYGEDIRHHLVKEILDYQQYVGL